MSLRLVVSSKSLQVSRMPYVSAFSTFKFGICSNHDLFIQQAINLKTRTSALKYDCLDLDLKAIVGQLQDLLELSPRYLMRTFYF